MPIEPSSLVEERSVTLRRYRATASSLAGICAALTMTVWGAIWASIPLSGNPLSRRWLEGGEHVSDKEHAARAVIIRPPVLVGLEFGIVIARREPTGGLAEIASPDALVDVNRRVGHHGVQQVLEEAREGQRWRSVFHGRNPKRRIVPFRHQ